VPDAVIAVFERQPYWGPELQRQFVNAPIQVRECRKINDLSPPDEEQVPSLFVIDLTDDLNGCIEWLGTLERDVTGRRSIIVCARPHHRELEWILRDAGVTVFLSDVIPGDDFARLCRKQLGLLSRIS
jgi:hypothetical protein